MDIESCCVVSCILEQRHQRLTYVGIILDTLPVTAELCLVPLVLGRTLALRNNVYDMPRIYLVSRASIVKVLAYGLLDVIIITLSLLATNMPQNVR